MWICSQGGASSRETPSFLSGLSFRDRHLQEFTNYPSFGDLVLLLEPAYSAVGFAVHINSQPMNIRRAGD